MKKTIGISAAIIILLVGGYYLSRGRMSSDEIGRLSNQIAREAGKLETYHAALKTIDVRHAEFLNLRHSLAAFGGDESGEDEIIYLYRSIDSLCRLPEYKLDEITPSLEAVILFFRKWKGDEAVIDIPIQIKINGPYRPLAKLVERIEQSDYFSRIEYCRVKGDNNLYPDCAMEIKFIAGLTNHTGMFGFE